MEDIGKVIERAILAGKHRMAAREYMRTARSLERCADKFSRGVTSALAKGLATDAGVCARRPTTGHSEEGSFGSVVDGGL